MVGSLVFAIFLAPVLASRSCVHHAQACADEPRSCAGWSGSIALWSFFVARRAAVVLAGALILLGLVLFPRLGSEFTPRLQEGTSILRLTMAPSISLRESQRITMIVEKRLMAIPEIDGGEPHRPWRGGRSH